MNDQTTSKILSFEDARCSRDYKREFEKGEAIFWETFDALPKCLNVELFPGFNRNDYIEVLRFYIHCIEIGGLAVAGIEAIPNSEAHGDTQTNGER